MTIAAKSTRFNGQWFKTRIEAEWAVAFDFLGVPWAYEPGEVELDDGSKYWPDFRIGRGTNSNGDSHDGEFLEVKLLEGGRHENVERARRNGTDLWTVYGRPDPEWLWNTPYGVVNGVFKYAPFHYDADAMCGGTIVSAWIKDLASLAQNADLRDRDWRQMELHHIARDIVMACTVARNTRRDQDGDLWPGDLRVQAPTVQMEVLDRTLRRLGVPRTESSRMPFDEALTLAGELLRESGYPHWLKLSVRGSHHPTPIVDEHWLAAEKDWSQSWISGMGWTDANPNATVADDRALTKAPR